MNPISPKKLLSSKWTAVNPQNKEKHFVITDVEFDEDSNVIRCVNQAIMSKREVEIDWQTLKDSNVWKLGWV